MHSRILILIMTLGVSGCATLDRDSCLTADWQLIGFNDGVAGYEASRLEQHRDACSEYGIAPQMDDYLQGYDRGVSRYCTATNGYRTARAGKQLNAVCNGGPGLAFVRGFELGSVAHKQAVQLADAERELSTMRSEQRSDDRELNEKREQLVADGISTQARSFLLLEIDALQHDMRVRATAIKRQQQAVQMERRYLKDLESDLRQQL